MSLEDHSFLGKFSVWLGISFLLYAHWGSVHPEDLEVVVWDLSFHGLGFLSSCFSFDALWGSLRPEELEVVVRDLSSTHRGLQLVEPCFWVG